MEGGRAIGVLKDDARSSLAASSVSGKKRKIIKAEQIYRYIGKDGSRTVLGEDDDV